MPRTAKQSARPQGDAPQEAALHGETDRAELIRQRARKIWQEQGSDTYRPEDYELLAERLIHEEEKLGLPVNPYPVNQESDQESNRRK